MRRSRGLAEAEAAAFLDWDNTSQGARAGGIIECAKRLLISHGLHSLSPAERNMSPGTVRPGPPVHIQRTETRCADLWLRLGRSRKTCTRGRP
jgi:hypothetical protein